MKKTLVLLLAVFLVLTGCGGTARGDEVRVVLGNERLMGDYYHLVEGKRVGLITNQTGVNSEGKMTVHVLADDPAINLVALYTPEHGLDGVARAGAYVESYIHEELGIPVNSLYGRTRMPTEQMLQGVDVLLFDIQDIGARSYTYISTLNYCMIAAERDHKPIVVLDRPNPLGGLIVEGPVLETPYKSFVGIDQLPKAHGMTIGELAQFFNRNIGADLTIVPMEGYTRDMLFQDTGLPWVQTSPNIPDLDSAFGYMATGLGEGTGIFQADTFKWIGGRGINAETFANLLNGSGLEGVYFIPEYRGEAGGVRLQILDYYRFNPARTGIYALTYAKSLNDFVVPKSDKTIVMFDKIMGTAAIGRYLEQGLTPPEIEAKYASALEAFKEIRKQYLLYPTRGQGRTGGIEVVVEGVSIPFDSAPYIDSNNRVMVPLRSIVEALGGQLEWVGETEQILIYKEGRNIQFTVGSTVAFLDGKESTMDTFPVIRNNRTMVPLRYVGEYLGRVVDWNPSFQRVIIE